MGRLHWERSSGFVFYIKGLISHVISASADINNQTVKVSMIFVYDNNANCSKIYYKKSPYQAPENNSPYYSDLSDGNLESIYDSLVYSSTNQLQEIHRIDTIYGYKAKHMIKFYYENISDTTLYKIEEYRLNNDGDFFLFDQLLLTTNSIDNPVYKHMWFFPFVWDISFISGGGGNVMSFPILYDAPSTYLKKYTPLVAKCITNYKIYNHWGSYNYTKTIFDYNYSKDSLLLQSTKRDFFDYVNYHYKKGKR